MLRNGYFVWFIDNLEFMILIFNVDTFELEINAWSLEFRYPCRIWRLQDIELHNMKINVWSLEFTYPCRYEGYRTLNCIIWRSMLDLEFTYPCRVWRLQDIELHNMEINAWSWVYISLQGMTASGHRTA